MTPGNEPFATDETALVIPTPSSRAVTIFIAVLFLVEITLVGLHFVNAFTDHSASTLRQFFNLDDEANVPTWFSSAQLLGVAGTLVLGLLSNVGRRLPGRRLLWMIAIGLVLMSMDEAAGVHEQVSRVLRQYEVFPRFKGEHGLWIPLYAAAGLVGLGIAARSLAELFRHARTAVLISATGVLIAILGVVGLEVLSYEYLRQPGRESLYMVEVGLEEFLEMAGVTVLWLGVFRLFGASR